MATSFSEISDLLVAGFGRRKLDLARAAGVSPGTLSKPGWSVDLCVRLAILTGVDVVSILHAVGRADTAAGLEILWGRRRMIPIPRDAVAHWEDLKRCPPRTRRLAMNLIARVANDLSGSPRRRARR